MFFENFNLLDFALMTGAILLSLVVHEFSHGLMAYALGDSTAKDDGRLSLNPLKHLDPLGTLLIILVHFGWAKPVMMNPRNFKNQRDGIFLTALAGPLSNIILGFVGVFILKGMYVNNIHITALATFLLYFIQFNFIIASFNLIPLPPLDGFKVFTRILSDKSFEKAMIFEAKYGFLPVLIFIIFCTASKIRAYAFLADPLFKFAEKILLN